MKIAYRFLLVLLISMLLFGCGDKTASVEGKIVDGKGKPVPGVSMIFKQVQPTQGFEQFEVKTDADGVYRLTGLAPSSDYIISILSDKWKTKLTKNIKTLEAGQNLVLSDPIKIRFNSMKDGTVIDTKTDLQWFIYSIKDITAGNVVDTVTSLKEGGFTDWRLPSRKDLSSLLEEKIPTKTPSTEPVLVNKTCCAWVVDSNSEVDWKFYVEEGNELWASNKETPDNRIIVVRNSTSLPLAAPVTTTAAPVAGTQATPAPAIVPPVKEQAASKLQTETPSIKPTPDVRNASRKACAEKRTNASRLAKTTPETTPAKIQEPAKAVSPSKNAEPVKIADSVQSSMMTSLYFDAGSTTLKKEELAKLKALLVNIKGGKGTLIIDGHSDASSGTRSSNLILSVERSSSVVAALNKMGSGKNIKIELRASGDAKPTASNNTSEGQKKNRRVEVSFLPE